MDFHAVDLKGNTLLVQVSADVSSTGTLQRELRSLVEAKTDQPEGRALLLLLAPLHLALKY